MQHPTKDDDGAYAAISFELKPSDFFSSSNNGSDLSDYNAQFQQYLNSPHDHCQHKRSTPTSVTFVGEDTSKPSSRQSPAYYNALSSLGDVIVKAWSSSMKECLFLHNLELQDGSSVLSEAKLDRFRDQSLIVVLRDISERFMRFEAEKKVVSETTARQKDAEANRFTRHEVKNGLLSAIHLCNELKSSFEVSPLVDMKSKNSLLTLNKKSLAHTQSQETINASQLAHYTVDIPRYINDLDSTLHEVLDTVLAEAMCREVIYEVYRPMLERVDIVEILHGKLDSGPSSRFQIDCMPSPYPSLLFDPQLLKYIHRNALSNACKYGQKGGTIHTQLFFNASKNEFKMNIVNLPGEGHEDIMKLGRAGWDSIFEQGIRLHKYIDVLNSSHKVSSGDGAWIVQKCAKTLGGVCSIQFEKRRTIFSFKCPAQRCQMQSQNSLKGTTEFQVPSNTFGIVMDDSKMQRKLLSRFLLVCGVKEDKSTILGQNAKEIYEFENFVVNMVAKHPSSYFLVIVDENLDVNDDNSCEVRVSGSTCVENILKRMSVEDEKRTLMVVRSANDSAEEVALYKSRAHGFIAKAPVKNKSALHKIHYLWVDRFPEFDENSCLTNASNIMSRDAAEDDQATRRDLMQSIVHINSITQNLTTIQLQDRWPFLWDKFHMLKGDLMTLDVGRCHVLTEAVRCVEEFRGRDLPDDFQKRWLVIQSLISSSM